LKEEVLSLKIRFIYFVFLCMLFAGLSGCRLIPFWPKEKEEESGYDALATHVDEGEPLIKSGLTLRVGVTASGSPAVQEVLKEVDLNGQILMPLIGAVECEGLTVVGLQDKLTESYKKYFIDPQVSVNFVYVENGSMKSPWGQVLLMGEIARPGPVNMPSTRDLTVVRALMMAGGATPMADKRKVRVTRREESGALKRFIVDIEKIGKDGRGDLDIRLKPGDVVWVPESWY